MSRLLYKSGIPSDAKLETVTRNGEWVSPGARSDDMVAVQGAICSTIQLGRTVQHGLISSNGIYSTKSARKLSRSK